MSLKISAVICTRNRAKLLPEAIHSFFAQTLPVNEFEILVVDNASTDETPAVIRQCIENAPQGLTVFSVCETVLGISSARNCGVEHANADIIAFLDDDEIATPNWLAGLLDVYAEFPQAWAVGGKIEARWDQPPPNWMDDRAFRTLGLLDMGDEIIQLTQIPLLNGGNSSFRREVFETAGRFRSDLGRQGAAIFGGEETELQLRILARNKPILYTPFAVIKHIIDAQRLRRRFFMRQSYFQGRTRARMATSPAEDVQWLTQWGFRIARFSLRAVLYPLQPHRRIVALCALAQWLGYWREIFTFGRDAPRRVKRQS